MKQYHITEIESLEDYRLRLTFDDGVIGILDMKEIISVGGIFSKLADSEFFSHVDKSDDGRYIKWGDEIDFCADALHEEARMATLEPATV